MALDVFNIPEENLPALHKAIERLSKKSEKAGTGPIKVTELSKIKDEHSNGFFSITVQVAIEGEPIKHNGWRFVARIDHNDDPTGGKNIIYTGPGDFCPQEYRDAAANCEHCGYQRKRRDTFILFHDETGVYKQIGRTCVKEFTGGLDPLAVAGHLERLKKAIELAEESGENKPLSSRRHIDLTVFLAYTAKNIREHGWVSTKMAFEDPTLTSTRDRALSEMFNNGSIDSLPSEQDYELGEKAMAWAATLDPDKDDYTHNIHTLATDGYGDYKAVGLAASIIRVYDLHMLREQDKTTGYIGAIGDKIKGEVTVVSNEAREGDFGPYNMVTMRAVKGGEIITAMGRFSPAVGERFTLSAKVKGHNEYKGTKQTQVSYCKKV